MQEPEEKSVVVIEDPTATKTEIDRSAHQPFNVGKFSSVAKQTVDDLALDSDDSALSDSPPPVKPAAQRGKAKRASSARNKKLIVKSESESESGSDFNPNDNDYAMNSEDEERQMVDAIAASLDDDEDAPRSGRSAPKKPAQARGKKETLREKLARAADCELQTQATGALLMGAARAKRPIREDDVASNSPFPATASEIAAENATSGSATPFNELSLSEDDSDDDFNSDSSLEVPLKKGRRIGGRRLGDGEQPDSPAYGIEGLEDMDAETSLKTYREIKEAQKRKRREQEEALKPIREAERALKKELGRKLTNGERNMIRLQHVS